MSDRIPSKRFPKSFLWGASTAAHQVEGGTHNQWSVWELENAKTLAAQASYRYEDEPNWEAIKKQAKRPDNYVSGRATDHYNLYDHDFAIAEKLGLNAFRFSIEWSRIEPEQGVWNAEAVQHYKQYIAAMKKRGLEPVVTLFHFTLPVWFAELGGFEKRANIKHFVAFAERVMSELGGSVRYIITINEPEIYAHESYFAGHWPPQQTSRLAKWRVLRHLATAHNRVADRLHRANRRYKVSVAQNSTYYYPGDDAWLSRASTAVFQYLHDDYFLRKVVRRCDFIGVNYYFSNRVYGYRVHNPNQRLNDLSWDMHPADLQFVLERLARRYKKPLLITENGLADADDSDRQWWLQQTITAMQRALDEDVQLIGYLHWSLLDNFEWDKGFWPRFGLVEVDYATGKRTVRRSALSLARVIRKLRQE